MNRYVGMLVLFCVAIPLQMRAAESEPKASGGTLHTFAPAQYHHEFSGAVPPVLRIAPGDTVRTKTIDAAGVDDTGVAVTRAGNPQTGPFYVNGAQPGDTLVIRFDRIELNRDTAGFSNTLHPRALDPALRDKPYFQRPRTFTDAYLNWTLDRSSGTAVLSQPSEKLRDFKVSLAPFLGGIGVAPAGQAGIPTSDLGPFGGNLDYPRLIQGTTLFLPVFHPGALLYIGDAHAAQADGEITGTGFETSMAVEFTVDLIKGRTLGQPRAEDAEYVMVSGIASTLDDAFAHATSGLARWLTDTYGLSDMDVSLVLGSSVEYDIAEVVDPQRHVVAKIRKELLGKISRP